MPIWQIISTLIVVYGKRLNKITKAGNEERRPKTGPLNGERIREKRKNQERSLRKSNQRGERKTRRIWCLES